MKKVKIVVLIFSFIVCACFAKTQQEEYQNDVLYSEEYFDYLIECASIEYNEQNANSQKKGFNDSEITIESENQNQDIIEEDYETFQLGVEKNEISKYSQAYVKEDSKTTINVSKNFSFVQDTLKIKNKYNSNDYRIIVGAEYAINKFLKISSGLETNYRSMDQAPISKKVYFTPELTLNDRVSVKFHNKFNTLNKSQDHDIGLNISPFKSKILDLGVYTGLTQYQDGTNSESVSFSTNFYF